MSNEAREHQGIHGVVVVPLEAHPDGRGSVTEVFRRSWIPGMREAVQANLSRSRAGVLRGLHFHRKQADYWILIDGRYTVGLYDARRGSPTEGRSETMDVSADDRRAIYIPRGVAHGFYAETDVVLQYLVDEFFTGGDEFGIAWNDPGVGIAWPAVDPILSDRDRSNPPLAEVLRDPPPFEG
jgi:dTDP-4-dehydrorhamnose 3,5-epimerase